MQLRTGSNVITAKQVKPTSHGKSDFFSWQLYRWLVKNPDAIRIYERNENNNGSVVDSDLIIGYPRDGDWVHGRQLRNLCLQGADLQCYAYGAAHGSRDWKDVTYDFWEAYVLRGVCAIHGDYAHKWELNGDTRVCEYCYKTESKVIRGTTQVVWGCS